MISQSQTSLNEVLKYSTSRDAQFGLNPIDYAQVFLEYRGGYASLTELVNFAGRKNFSKISNALNLRDPYQEFRSEALRIHNEGRTMFGQFFLEKPNAEIEKLNYVLHRYSELQREGKSIVGQHNQMPTDVVQAVAELSAEAYQVFLKQYFSKEQIFLDWLTKDWPIEQPGLYSASKPDDTFQLALPKQEDYQIALGTENLTTVPKQTATQSS